MRQVFPLEMKAAEATVTTVRLLSLKNDHKKYFF